MYFLDGLYFLKKFSFNNLIDITNFPDFNINFFIHKYIHKYIVT